MSRPVQNKARNEVIIRPPQPDDWEAYVSAVKRSGALHRPWISQKARNRKEFTDFLDRCLADNYFGYLVIHRSSGALVGCVSIFDVVRRNLQSGMLG